MSFFYDLQELIRNAPLPPNHYLIFQALDLSVIKDRSYTVGATGYSQHAMLRVLIVNLEAIKFVVRLIEYLNLIPRLLESCFITETLVATTKLILQKPFQKV